MHKSSSAIFIALAFTVLASQASGSVLSCNDEQPLYLTANADSITNTDITLAQGESLYLIASGSWRSCYGDKCVSGADGGSEYNPTAKLPTARNHALIGSMNDGKTWFEVGYTEEILGPGTLLLAINDSNDDVTDNIGHLDIMMFATPCKQHINCESGPKNFEVYSSVEHLRTGFIIPAGVAVDITATGKWAMCKDLDACESGPAGLSGDAANRVRFLDSAPANALIASMDGMKTWFGVGAEGTITGPGELVLASNDLDDLATDNTGSVTVTITPQCRNIDWTPYAMGPDHQTCLRTMCDLPNRWFNKPAGQAYGMEHASCLPCLHADRKICDQCYEEKQLCAYDEDNVRFYCKDHQLRGK